MRDRIRPFFRRRGRQNSIAAEKPVERRLAAILAADVVGYSRLMGADEIGTLRALRAHRREAIDPRIEAHGGHIVKSTGDGILAQFPSAVEAVACAIAVQQRIALRNSGLADDSKLILRIGINIGDIISDGGDIFGDGVNVAARLESVCVPGGLCISRALRDQVRDKLPIIFEDLGQQQVKNIARPLRAFGLTPDAIAAIPELAPNRHRAPARNRSFLIVAVLVAIVVAIGATAWRLRAPLGLQQMAQSNVPSPAPYGAARIPIAVLPLEALGLVGNEDYFADGLTEDIIVALGRFRDLAVMSRSTVAAYKGKQSSPAEIGRDLTVRYVVAGTVRRAPDRLRISVNLADTQQNTLLWSEKYDVEPKEVFAVEDNITQRISGSLAIRLTNLERARSEAKPPATLEAYDLVLRGRDRLARLTRSTNAEARGLFEHAIQLDPNYAPGYVGLGRVNLNSATQGWTQYPGETLDRAGKLARKAIEIDDLNPAAHALLGDVAVHFGDHDRAKEELKRAIDLNSSDPDTYKSLLGVLLYSGEIGGAIAAGEFLSQLQPDLPVHTAFNLGTAYLLADRAADAVRMLERSVERSPGNLYANVVLSAAYAAVGRQPDAQHLSERIRRQFPTFSREQFGSALRDPSLRDKLYRALENAGL